MSTLDDIKINLSTYYNTTFRQDDTVNLLNNDDDTVYLIIKDNNTVDTTTNYIIKNN